MAEFVQIVKCPVEGDWDVSPDKRKWLFTITNKKITEREYKINQKSIACLPKIMKIWKQNLIINVFESLPFYFNYVDSTRSKRLSKITYIYNMTTTPQKDFFPNSVFWCYQKTSTTVLVGAIPEKFSNMKTCVFLTFWYNFPSNRKGTT